MNAAVPVLLIVLALSGCTAQAEPADEACDMAYSKLSLVPNLTLERSAGTFTDNGNSYGGCIVHLTGDREEVAGVQYTNPLIYPSSGSPLYQRGWRVDREADGPDGSSFRIFKQGVFCLIRANDHRASRPPV